MLHFPKASGWPLTRIIIQMYSLECFLVAFWHFQAISIILTHLHRMKHCRRVVCDYTLIASLKGTGPKLFWNEIYSLELPPTWERMVILMTMMSRSAEVLGFQIPAARSCIDYFTCGPLVLPAITKIHTNTKHIGGKYGKFSANHSVGLSIKYWKPPSIITLQRQRYVKLCKNKDVKRMQN